MRSLLDWLWRSRLTWRATIPLTAALCLTIVATAGIGGTPGAVVLISAALVWGILLSRMFDNEARHVAALARAKGRTPPERRVRRLLFPWWARAVLLFGVLAVTVASAAVLESDGLVVLTLVLALGTAWLVERSVIEVRGRST